MRLLRARQQEAIDRVLWDTRESLRWIIGESANHDAAKVAAFRAESYLRDSLARAGVTLRNPEAEREARSSYPKAVSSGSTSKEEQT